MCVCVCVSANSLLLLHTCCDEEVFAACRADDEAAITCFWRPAGRGFRLGVRHIYTDTMACVRVWGVGGVWECGVCW